MSLQLNSPELTTLAAGVACDYLIQAIWQHADSPKLYEFIDRCSTAINRPFANVRLTALHVAVWNGSKSAISYLVSKGANLLAKDVSGYTPLHMAAMLCNSTTYDHVRDLHIQQGVSLETRNAFDGTAADLHEMCIPDDEALTCPSPQASLKDALMINSCYPPDVVHTETMRLNKESQAKQWLSAQTATMVSLPITVSKQALEKFRQNPPSLEVVQIPNTGTCGTVARTPIKAGDVIVEYVGEITHPQDPDDTYLFESIQGRKYRGMGAMANTGFANAMGIETRHERGLESRAYLVAASDIAPGEQILWDYGPYYQGKINPQMIEMNPEGLRKHLTSKSWKKILKQLKHVSADISSLFEAQKMNYIITTPHALFFAIQERLLTSAQIAGLFNVPMFFEFKTALMCAFNLARAYEALHPTDPESANQMLHDLQQSLLKLKDERPDKPFQRLHRAIADAYGEMANKKNISPQEALQNALSQKHQFTNAQLAQEQKEWVRIIRRDEKQLAKHGIKAGPVLFGQH